MASERADPLPLSLRSAVEATMASEHHLFEIAGTQLGWRSTCPSTTPFQMCGPWWSTCIEGYDWLCTYSTDSPAGTVSFTLSGNRHFCNDIRDETINAWFKFSLLDREGRPVPSRTRASSFQNWRIQQNWKWECPGFITRDDVERRQEYLNKDGCFTVRCDIAIKPFTAKADAFVTVPPSDLHQHLGDLLARKDGADVAFQVAGGETFSAHRCVLAARSPVFRAQLFGEMKEGKSTGDGFVIPIDDMEAQVFSSLLTFIYTDSLPPETDSHAEQDGDGDDDEAMVQYLHLLAAADRYDLERMKLVCQEKLCKYIRAESVAAMLVSADRHRCPGLKEACFHFLSSSANLDSFTETDGFEVLNASCPPVLKELLAKLATILIL